MAFRREQFFHGLTPIYPSLGKQISLPVFLLFPLIFPFSPSRAPPSSNYAVIFFLIVIHHQVLARWKPAISRVSKRDKSNLSDTIKSFDARCPLLFSLFFSPPSPVHAYRRIYARRLKMDDRRATRIRFSGGEARAENRKKIGRDQLRTVRLSAVPFLSLQRCEE